MNPAGELAQFLECAREFFSRPLEHFLRPGRILLEPALRQPKRKRDRDESLLRAVVEIPLELPARIVAGSDDALA